MLGDADCFIYALNLRMIESFDKFWSKQTLNPSRLILPPHLHCFLPQLHDVLSTRPKVSAQDLEFQLAIYIEFGCDGVPNMNI